MKEIKLTIKNEEKVIAEAVALLKKGGVILYPTDTCYGLAVDIFNENAFRKLYSLKEMPYAKPVSIMVSDLNDAKKYGRFFELAADIAAKFWPGPLTIILNRKSSLPRFLNSGVETVGIRVPAYSFVNKLVAAYGLPLTTTSANISTKKEAYSVAEFKKQFKGRTLMPELAIDGGKLKGTAPSTVIEVSDDAVRFFREGKLGRKLKNYMEKRKK